MIFPKNVPDPARGNWQGDDGEWQSPKATEQIAAEIMADHQAGLLEERPARCPTCGQPITNQAAATDRESP